MPSKREHQAHHGGMIDGLGASVGPLSMKPARQDEDGRAWVLATSGRTSWRGTGLTGIAGAPRGEEPTPKRMTGAGRGPTAAVMDEVRPEFNGGTSVGQQVKGQPRPSGNAREQSTKRAGSTSTFSNS
ncbi:hypothetical protein B0T13DRAFT_486303 [Neurospora crassa]|nr:hypothetical protein B0T13DRAFT_486303 [Neurospora crassa]